MTEAKELIEQMLVESEAPDVLKDIQKMNRDMKKIYSAMMRLEPATRKLNIASSGLPAVTGKADEIVFNASVDFNQARMKLEDMMDKLVQVEFILKRV